LNWQARAVSVFDTMNAAAMAFLAYRFAHSHTPKWARLYNLAGLIHALTIFITKFLERRTSRLKFAIGVYTAHLAIFGQYLDAILSSNTSLRRGVSTVMNDYKNDQVRFLEDIPPRGSFTRYVSDAYRLLCGNFQLTADTHDVSLVSLKGSIVLDALQKDILLAAGTVSVRLSKENKELTLDCGKGGNIELATGATSTGPRVSVRDNPLDAAIEIRFNSQIFISLTRHRILLKAGSGSLVINDNGVFIGGTKVKVNALGQVIVGAPQQDANAAPAAPPPPGPPPAPPPAS
jgi:hypothetical protein